MISDANMILKKICKMFFFSFLRHSTDVLWLYIPSFHCFSFSLCCFTVNDDEVNFTLVLIWSTDWRAQKKENANFMRSNETRRFVVNARSISDTRFVSDEDHYWCVSKWRGRGEFGVNKNERKKREREYDHWIRRSYSHNDKRTAILAYFLILGQ